MKKIGKAGMPFDWSKPVHLDAGSDRTLPVDNMHRAEYAKFLTDFLIAKAENTNYVTERKRRVGAGKKFLSKTMQARDHRVFKKEYCEIITRSSRQIILPSRPTV